ncbi:hypothetical protein CgunFtcFv8_000194 [Champsocephalus gunnari]|uniref:SRCR domain-containing protein n=1 Tax=Champsocephalus gunnari TaxID=52237 RepID=A0AAN8DHB2_CHAGU|nr:hypothetical protein CgunFtcFv8_000194 [Champsocephalus gunnari]
MMLLLFLFLLLCTAIAKDEDRLILIDGSNPCEGIIQIYHDNKLGYIGDKHWSEKTEDVVCKSTQCGKGNGSTQEPAMRPLDKVWLNEVKCKGHESHLGECTHPGFGISQFDTGTLRKIQCSNKINISLDGYACAGAVKYSTDAGETYSGNFCKDNGWDKDKDAPNMLCKSLKCGTAKEIPKKPWITLKKSEKMWADCSGIKGLTNLWQCATAKKGSACLNPATVICSDHEILQLSGDASNVCSGLLRQRNGKTWTPVRDIKRSTEWCERMNCGTSAHSSLADDGLQLNCTDNVRVVLMDKGEPSHCYGEVYIERNNYSQPVCASLWSDKEAEVVCNELRCGSSVLGNDEKSSRGEDMDDVIMHNVECSGTESSLWHCRAQRDQNLRCSSKAYVVCSESMEVRLKDTPGTCAGRLEIKYEGKWQRVDKQGWEDKNSNVVCNQLNCTESVKNKGNFQKYSQGSGEFLANTITCGRNDDSISKCVVKNRSPGYSDITGRLDSNVKKEAVGITCKGHAMIFLDGDSCSGKVGIKNLKQKYWLSGSNVTWNKETANTVCQEMHCGGVLNVNNTLPGREEKVWDKFYSCSGNETSLFNCGETQNPKDLNFTIATVKCSGEKTIKLSEGCLGYVNVCLNGECGGVCANPWTDEDSRMLCTSQNCGEHVLKPITKTKPMKVKFKSVHCTEMTHNLTKCNLVSFDDNDKTCNNDPAYVVCSGSVKARFTPSREKCSGGLEVNYEKQWLPVCKDALKDIKTRHTICRELDCGQAAAEIKDGPKTAKGHVLSEIDDSGDDSKALKQCMMKTNAGPCTPADLQCSSSSMFALFGGTACSGNLFVHSKDNNKSAVSTEGWTETMGNILCSNLNCGNLISNETRKTTASWTTSFSCAGVQNLKSIWDCETSPLPSSNTNQIFIKCQDEPKVNLSTQCAGEVTVNDLEVCNTNWEDRYSRLVCQELSCSNAIGFSAVKEPIKNKDYFHVNCEENHYQIGQCKRVKGKCEKTLVSVFCAGNVKFNSTEECGGQIQVNYRNKWEKVCPLAKPFPEKLLETLCENCEGYNSSIKGSEVFNRVDLETTLSCTKDHNDLMHCVEQKRCVGQKPAEIYCNGYVPKPEKTAAHLPPPVGIILGVGLLLVLVIIIVVIIRICIVNKGKNISMRMLRKRMSTKEVEIESGDYDNIPDMSNQMEDLGAARFREDGSFHSNNDVSDAAEMQPLTLQTLTAAEGEHLLQDVPMDKVSGKFCSSFIPSVYNGVTAEEEDPQEDYDDIEACPEFTQTEAEVHESPQESTAEEPLLVEGDDDYLVPGQDG